MNTPEEIKKQIETIIKAHEELMLITPSLGRKGVVKSLIKLIQDTEEKTKGIIEKLKDKYDQDDMIKYDVLEELLNKLSQKEGKKE